MPKRIDYLTENSRPIAEDMADRYGTLKNVLSAGVILFAELTPEEREVYMAKAVGKDIQSGEDILRKKICKILNDLGVLPSKKSSHRRLKNPKSA